MKNVIVGDTIRLTWISSGALPSEIYGAIFDGAETLVSSSTMSSSGNGHYYLDVTLPDTPGYYAAELNAVINSFPYRRKIKIKGVTGEVD